MGFRSSRSNRANNPGSQAKCEVVREALGRETLVTDICWAPRLMAAHGGQPENGRTRAIGSAEKNKSESDTVGQVVRRIRIGQGGARCWFTQCYLEAPSMVPENGWWYGFKDVICAVLAAGTRRATRSTGPVTCGGGGR